MSELYTWGANSQGQLGLGYESEMCTRPVRLAAADLPANLCVDDIRQICGGGAHLLLLAGGGDGGTTTTTVFACGWNNRGQLGVRRTTKSQSRLTAIDAKHFACENSDGSNYVCAVRAGWDCSAAITVNGDVYLWGSNAFEQLGVGKEFLLYTASPRKLQLPDDAGACLDVQFGLRSTVFATANALYIIAAQRRRAALLAGAHAAGYHAETLLDPVTGVTYVKIKVAVEHVACGSAHVSFAFGAYVQAIGDNKYGQCEPPRCDTVWMLRSGWAHNAVLTASAEVLLWGRNDYGQLGRPQADASVGAAALGRALHLPPVAEGADGRVVDVQLGAEHGAVLRANGDMCTWGWNEHGNCGNGSEVNAFDAVRVELPGSCRMIGTGAGFCVAVV